MCVILHLLVGKGSHVNFHVYICYLISDQLIVAATHKSRDKMAVNLQRKNAMKRLATDLHELELQPVENVSAAPLEENMLEWHCNFKHEDIIYHLILFLTDKYPYESPSAEFVPVGFRYEAFILNK